MTTATGTASTASAVTPATPTGRARPARPTGPTTAARLRPTRATVLGGLLGGAATSAGVALTATSGWLVVRASERPGRASPPSSRPS